MTKVNFLVMDGIKNKFLIIDSRSKDIHLTGEQIRFLADSRNMDTGGCDQIAILKNSSISDCFMEIYNSDGGEVEACGNVTRCVGWLLSNEKSINDTTIETLAGILNSTKVGENRVKIDMGEARLKWNEIPLSIDCDTTSVPLEVDNLQNPVAVNVGNPHAVFFIDNIDEIDFDENNIGSRIENHEVFPNRVNVGIAQIIDRDNIKLRVFERGTGETLACGTGACAATIAAIRKNYTDRKVTVELKGGNLEIEWTSNNRIYMTGDVNFEREGQIDI